MLIDWIAAALPLATTDDTNVLLSLFSNIILWSRVALGIGLVIFVHELGHFVAAKTFGVKCEKFYVGFDVPIRIGPIRFPRTLGKFRYGETEYGIGVIPLGGYVKMLGQDDDPRKQDEEAKRIRQGDAEVDDDAPPAFDPRSFPAKPVWQRMIIISAGVVMNVITGVIFAAIAYGYGVSYSPAIVGGVMPGGPAWQAGIEPGGKVVSVGTWQDDQMHFREMRLEILTEGLKKPDEPLDLAIRYDDGTRHFKLHSQSRPELKDFKMIGLSIPNSLTLSSDDIVHPNSAAAEVLTDEFAGASIVAFDGNAINSDAIVPGSPFFHYLYTNPEKTIDLSLRLQDGSRREVGLPPQQAKSLGIRFAVGPIVALVEDGPAAQAGLKVGDVIHSVNGNESPDAYGMALALVGTTEEVILGIRRGSESDSELIEIKIQPGDSLQTMAPTESISGEIAINAVGFAYRPMPVIGELVGPATDNSSGESDSGGQVSQLQPGDKIQEIQLLMDSSQKPEWFKNERYQKIFEQLEKGWELSPATPLNTLRETIQLLPEGARMLVKVSRPPEGRVVSATTVVRKDGRVMFRRGLLLPPSQSVQQAGSVGEALQLGVKEGSRRFKDVLRFLGMLPQGRIKLRHVGGPLEIVNIAKHEAEKGISPQLMFLTMLSMNLAILNFLPIPALDGGHMVFLLYELVAGKRANEQLEFRLTVAGLLTLLMLMAVVFANDIFRHLPN
jgi:regulator of sigma E protease